MPLPRLFGRSRAALAAPIAETPRGSRREIFPPKDAHAAPPPDRAALDAALAMGDGQPVGEAVMAAVAAHIHHARAITGTLGGPPSPIATGLHVRKSSLPDWWHEGGNLCLVGNDVQHFEIGLGFIPKPARRSLVVVGSRSRVPNMVVSDGPALIVCGDDVGMAGGGLAANGPSSILIGEKSTATWMPNVSSFNGGIVIVGRDNMWAPGVTFMTDDSHRIFDIESGRRINRHGGRIVTGEHVWLGFHVSASGDAFVGEGGIVGQGSYLKDVSLPPNAVSVGRVAKPVRLGATWARDDLPPE